VHSEQFLINRLAVLIFDPSRVSLILLIPNDLKSEVRVVGFGFDDPSAHSAASANKEQQNAIAQTEL
jgi:hypothetical protein